MAMYERRGSIESFARSRTASPTGSERRKLSFNPLAEWDPPAAEQPPPVPAFEVSKGKRIAQVVIAVIYCLLAAGIVFGFAAIKPVFVAEGVYKDKCTKKELEDGVWVCYEQELRLNLMFTIAAVSTNVCALPVGTVLDRYGPRVASIVGCVCLAVGALLLAFAKDIPGDAYIPGYLFLALGGPFVFISSFQLSNTFPQHSGLILALLTGAFDTSSALFLIYRLIYQGTNGSFNTRKFFLIYLIVPVLILIAQLVVMPAKSYKSVGELVKQVEDTQNDISRTNGVGEEHVQNARQEHYDTVATEVSELLGSKSGDKQAKQEEDKIRRSGVWGALHGKTALQQILSPWWVLITIFTMVQMLRINYFVATVRTQYSEMLGSHSKAVTVNEFFDIALPLGGVVAIPFIGFVLDHTSTPFVLAMLVSIATAIGVFGLVPEMWAAYINIILFVLYRPFYYTAVSDYSAKVFGFDTFGKVYGLIICTAGIFNFAQAGLDALTHVTFHNNPIPVNAILLAVAFVVGAVLVGFVYRKSVTLEKDLLREEADEATERLMPGANGEQVNRPHGHETYGTN